MSHPALDGWAVELAPHPLFAVDLVAAGDSVIAAWITERDAMVFNTNGAFLGPVAVPPFAGQPGGAGWTTLLEGLHVLAGVYLPVATLPHGTLHVSADGRLQAWYGTDDRLVLVDDTAIELEREGNAPLVAVGLDRELGTLVALDQAAHVHVYQQSIYVGAFPLALELGGHVQLLVPDGASHFFLVEPLSVHVISLNGDVLASATGLPAAAAAACDPSGRVLVRAGRDRPWLRVYDDRLTELGGGEVAQLVAGLHVASGRLPAPLADTPAHALALAADGSLAVAVAGWLCLTWLDVLDAWPRPRRLL